jgi:Fic family protein
MAEILDAHWEMSLDAPARRDQRGGKYHPYLPDLLIGRPLVIEGDLGAYAAEVENTVRRLVLGEGAAPLERLARFLLRSEAIASSRIEGLQVSAQQVALAELAQSEGLSETGFTQSARLVANNITAVRQAATTLAKLPALTLESISELRAGLLPDDPNQGLRTVQNWIGGSDWHPLDAQFVPPPPTQVGPLMQDLVAYASGAAAAPLLQAALVHAQFETIHPFTDGNGRVGRALIHTVLTRRGLTRSAILPVSLVLLTRADAYVDGLTAYRYLGPADQPTAHLATSRWLTTFLDAVAVAAEQAEQFSEQLAELRAEWHTRHGSHRVSIDLTERPRGNSAVTRILELLPEVPVMTTRTAERLLNVSFPAARNALEELADAKILHRKQVDKGTTGYLAREVFDLLTLTERRLASTRWDTRQAAPNRPAPARPQR